jgi:ribosome-associated toxin RatA of RatAB toxin-antitoxin module
MAKIDKDIMINASQEKIFDFVSNPGNLPRIWPSLVEITNQTLLPNGGFSFQWVYKMGGMRLKGTGAYTEYEADKWFTARTTGALESIITWTFRQTDINTTRVTFSIDYKVPLVLLRWLTGDFVVKMNEQEANTILDNLKSIFMTKATHV